MPDKSILEVKNVPIDEIRRLLDEKQSITEVAAHYEVNPRTLTRFISGKLERRYYWLSITTIEARSKR